MEGADGGHESRGQRSINTPPVSPALFTPLALTFIAPPRSSVISIEPSPRILHRRSVFSSKKLILASPSSLIEILEVLKITPLAAMDPESPFSRHPTNAEEEDSPLHQSTFAPGHPTTDSYPEDIAFEAEEDAEDQAAGDMADEEEQDGGGEAG
jgi:hypothetical protein